MVMERHSFVSSTELIAAEGLRLARTSVLRRLRTRGERKWERAKRGGRYPVKGTVEWLEMRNFNPHNYVLVRQVYP